MQARCQAVIDAQGGLTPCYLLYYFNVFSGLIASSCIKRWQYFNHQLGTEVPR